MKKYLLIFLLLPCIQSFAADSHAVQAFSESLKHMSQPKTVFQTVTNLSPYTKIDQDKVINAFAKHHILVYFYDSRYSDERKFARIVKAFAIEHRFGVVPVKITGKTLPEFPNTIPIFSLITSHKIDRFGVFFTPAIYLADPISHKIRNATNHQFLASSALNFVIWNAILEYNMTREQLRAYGE